MQAKAPESFRGVEVVTKANVYFEGKVVSHTVRFSDGSKKTLGLIYPGEYHFGTDAPERMQIVAGACRVRIDGESTSPSVCACWSAIIRGSPKSTCSAA